VLSSAGRVWMHGRSEEAMKIFGAWRLRVWMVEEDVAWG
jgi:hypothetical protein